MMVEKLLQARVLSASVAWMALLGASGCMESGVIDDSACPTPCDDHVLCTSDARAGNARDCGAECVFTPITDCVHGDTCCPDGCDNSTDDDCSLTCGNGTVDAGEACDGDCPTSCNDGRICTRDTLVGNVANCSAQCSFTSITEPQDGDGCCPPGGHDAGDSDCEPRCGNGAPDDGEDCDTGGDSATCDSDCTVPDCGDDHVNPAANERCEGQPGCDLVTCRPIVVSIISVNASADDGNVAANTLDDNLAGESRWSAEGDGVQIQYGFSGTSMVGQMRIAFYRGTERQALFSVAVSADDTTWTTVLDHAQSSGTTAGYETFTFPLTTARALRIIGHGNNSANLADRGMTSIIEVRIEDFPIDLGSVQSTTKDITDFAITGFADREGVIGASTIGVVLPFGTDVTALVPVITHNGASISPASNVAQDFTSPVFYTVRAADSSTKVYTVIVLAVPSDGDVHYVATNGNDGNPGTFEEPWVDWQYAVDQLDAGDVLFIRQGTYTPASMGDCYGVRLAHKSDLHIMAFPAESPVFSFDGVSVSGYCSGFIVDYASNIHIKGLRITGMVEADGYESSGLSLSDTEDSIVEFCEVDHIGGYGFTVGGASNNNLFLNCDAHDNADPYFDYENANGFNVTGASASTNTTFRGCRAWRNCDDGWDYFGNGGYAVMDNCRAFWNGYLPDSFEVSAGDGNGFKLGPGSYASTSVMRLLTNCISAENTSSGYDQSFDAGWEYFPAYFYNCASYNNPSTGWAYGFDVGVVNEFKNNLSFGDGNEYVGVSENITKCNSWDDIAHCDSWGGVRVEVGADDFVVDGLDVAQLAAPRKPDGSLPEVTFLHLREGSDLIDAGANIDGSECLAEACPDIGPFELR